MAQDRPQWPSPFRASVPAAHRCPQATPAQGPLVPLQAAGPELVVFRRRCRVLGGVSIPALEVWSRIGAQEHPLKLILQCRSCLCPFPQAEGGNEEVLVRL